MTESPYGVGQWGSPTLPPPTSADALAAAAAVVRSEQKTVHKFRISIGDTGCFPAGNVTRARMAPGNMQSSDVEYWAEVLPDTTETMWVTVVGTGHLIPYGFHAVATVFDGSFVWHVVVDRRAA